MEAEGYFYTRLQNLANDLVAAKICAMEGGTAAMLTSSGQAVNFYAIFNICEAGDHNGSCGVLAFGINGGRELSIKFMDKLKLASIVTHVADSKTCLLHPATSYCSNVTGIINKF